MVHQPIRKAYLTIGFVALVAAMTVGSGLALLQYDKKEFADYWHGRANQSGSFTFVVIGDSAAQGLGASKPENGYVGLLTQHIEQTTGRTVRVVNLSKSGATVHDALTQQVPRLNAYHADLVLVEIGANDMKHYNADSFAADYEQILQALPPGKSVIAELPVFGGRKNLTHRSEAANQTIHGLATTYHTPVAPLFAELRDHQSPWIYASDFFHPNNRGYRLWHDAFWPVIRPMVEPAANSKIDTVHF